MIETVKAVVFDCDGVMFDSQQANLNFYNQIFRYFGVPEVTVDQHDRVRVCHTASSPQVFEELLGPERVSEAISYASGVDYSQFIPQLKVEPGLLAVLERLALYYPLAIATNRGSSMVKILEHFDLSHYFTHVITHLDVGRPKPHPDILFEAAKRLGKSPDALLFVGDSEFDKQAAQGSGCLFVSYKWDGGVRIDHHIDLLKILNVENSYP